jgi:hypothetical protein
MVATSAQGAEGAARLHAYWLTGEGRAKWNTWTELYHHLVKFMEPEKAKDTTSRWFHERFGFYAGADLNRVRQGKPPRGKVIGPG